MSEKWDIISDQLTEQEASTLYTVGAPTHQFLLENPWMLEMHLERLKRLEQLGLICKTETGYALTISVEEMEQIYEQVAKQFYFAQISQMGYPILAACIEKHIAPTAFTESAFMTQEIKEYLTEEYTRYENTGIVPEPFLRLRDKEYREKFEHEIQNTFFQTYDLQTMEDYIHAAKQEAIAIVASPCCTPFVKERVEAVVADICQMSLRHVHELKKVLNFNPGYI